MSWATYTDRLIADGLSKACIIGLDGNVWAASPGFNPSVQEFRALVECFRDSDNARKSGLVLDSTKYIVLGVDGSVIRGKKDQDGVHCVKLNRAIIIGVYESGTTAQQAAGIVEKLGDYLRGAGF